MVSETLGFIIQDFPDLASDKIAYTTVGSDKCNVYYQAKSTFR